MRRGEKRMSTDTYRQWVLAAHPQGLPKPADFRLEHGPMPVPAAGEFLVRIVLIGLEPRLRLMLNPTTEANKAMRPDGGAAGLGRLVPSSAIGEVVQSNDPAFAPGDLVEGWFGWQTHAVTPARGLSDRHNPAGIVRVDPALGPLSAHLSILGIPGLTAWIALDHKPVAAGETLVVTSAAGTVGAIAAQLGKLAGARVVGLTGSDEKCAYLTDELGLDAAINYRTAGDLAAALRAACPNGVDHHFDNVGGPMAETIAAQFNAGARHTICGVVSQYNVDQGKWHQSNAFAGYFNIHAHVDEYDAARAALSKLLLAGRIRCVERVFDGLDQAPAAFAGLMAGDNIGKWLVRVGPDPA
jgi:NADPH-dependent curcumin reductase CurA